MRRSIAGCRGLLAGLYGTVAFFVTLHALLVNAGVIVAFAVALTIAVLISGLALRRLRLHAAVEHPGIDEPVPEPL